MSVALRPMGLGEILDRAIQILRTNLGLFVGIAALPEIVELAHLLASDFTKAQAATIGGSAAAMVGLNLILTWASLGATAIGTGAVCRAATWVVMDEPATVRSAYRAIRGREWRMIGIGFLEMFFSMWPMIPVIFVLFALLRVLVELPKAEFVTMLLVAIAIPCGALFPRYVLGFPAALAEGLTARQAIRRSVDLGREHRWKVFWIFVLPMVIALGLGEGLVLLIQWLKSVGSDAGAYSFLLSDLQDVVIVGVRLFTGTLSAIALTVTYYDLRVRKEGLDVALMMEHAGMTVEAPVVPVEEPAGAAGESWQRTEYREPDANSGAVATPWNVIASGQMPSDFEEAPGGDDCLDTEQAHANEGQQA